MIQGDIIQLLEKMVLTVLADDPEVFLVNIKIKPTNNIKIYIDSDTGLSINLLSKFNKKMYRILEETAVFPDGNFSLELSSPGLDEPLKLHRQYLKNIGRNVEVSLVSGEKKEGKLLSVSEERILVEDIKKTGKQPKPKASEAVQREILFTDITSTMVLIVFK